MANNLTASEPVITAAAVTAVVGAVVGVLISFGVVISPEQKDSVITAIVAFYTIALGVQAWWARRKSTPVVTAQKAIDAAFVATPGVDAKPTLSAPIVAAGAPAAVPPSKAA